MIQGLPLSIGMLSQRATAAGYPQFAQTCNLWYGDLDRTTIKQDELALLATEYVRFTQRHAIVIIIDNLGTSSSKKIGLELLLVLSAQEHSVGKVVLSAPFDRETRILFEDMLSEAIPLLSLMPLPDPQLITVIEHNTLICPNHFKMGSVNSSVVNSF